MEHQKKLSLLNEANNSKFVTRKLNTVDDNSEASYNATNEVTYNTEALKSSLWDYKDAYIIVRGNNSVAAAPETQVAFKDNAPFTKRITKIDETTIDDAEDLDVVMPMKNLIEYSSNHSETRGSLWFYSKDEAANIDADIANTDEFKSFKCKAAKLLGNTAAQPAPNTSNGVLKIAAVTVPLKYLSNLGRSLKMSLIN